MQFEQHVKKQLLALQRSLRLRFYLPGHESHLEKKLKEYRDTRDCRDTSLELIEFFEFKMLILLIVRLLHQSQVLAVRHELQQEVDLLVEKEEF